MAIEVLSRRDNMLIRRQTLAPGEATHWHVDRCHRFSVVVRGEKLALEYRDGSPIRAIDVHAGMADWDAPEPKMHRAVNIGAEPFEEIVTFLVDSPTMDPQPSNE